MLSPDNCYVCLRDQNADLSPDIPGGWTAMREVGGWYTITRDSDGLKILAWRANTNAAGTRGLYAVFAPIVVLRAFAAIEPLCVPARALWTAALGGNAAAIAVARRWPTWRFSGVERRNMNDQLTAVNGVRQLIYDGQTMPAPPLPTAGAPWRFAFDGTVVGTDVAARYRIDSLVRPSLHVTIGGHLLHTTFEDEPE